MKLYKIFPLLAVGCFTFASCSDIDDQYPEGMDLTQDQLQGSYEDMPDRMDATFSGMFTMMGEPYGVFGAGSGRVDDFGYIMAALSLDAEAADLTMANNNYNWFSAACELSTRNANYANPYIRYVTPYRHIGSANEIIASYPADTEDPDAINKIAQARAVRAYAYMALAPYFQFSYSTAADQPCIPILSDEADYTNNPRATVAEVYDYIMADLDYAVEHLAGYNRAGDKTKIDQQVAYGLRARANLNMGKFAEAAADAERAMQGYSPASMSDVSVPAFCNINEANWIWGIDITDAQAQNGGYATSSSWISAFSGDGYAAACACTPMINVLLYDKIPATDVRKGWWLNGDKYSPLLEGLTWGTTGVSGQDIVDLTLDDGSKVSYEAYTNVKFGMQSGVGNTVNNNDWPLMRAEEMILIQAEGLAKSGNESQARTVLQNFVRTYRDPSYTIPSSRTLENEIWFQRRVELWGEGFATSDTKRLNKPVVRFHDDVSSTNCPTAFAFNIEATDGWLNMRFPQTEMDNNQGIVDNTGGAQPVSGQNGHLRDGVTD